MNRRQRIVLICAAILWLCVASWTVQGMVVWWGYMRAGLTGHPMSALQIIITHFVFLWLEAGLLAVPVGVLLLIFRTRQRTKLSPK